MSSRSKKLEPTPPDVWKGLWYLVGEMHTRMHNHALHSTDNGVCGGVVINREAGHHPTLKYVKVMQDATATANLELVCVVDCVTIFAAKDLSKQWVTFYEKKEEYNLLYSNLDWEATTRVARTNHRSELSSVCPPRP